MVPEQIKPAFTGDTATAKANVIVKRQYRIAHINELSALPQPAPQVPGPNSTVSLFHKKQQPVPPEISGYEEPAPKKQKGFFSLNSSQ